MGYLIAHKGPFHNLNFIFDTAMLNVMEQIAMYFSCIYETDLYIFSYYHFAVPCGTPTVQPHSKRLVGGSVATAYSWPYAVSP